MLFDNGSLRPAAVSQLRVLADTVGRTLGVPVEAASALHSDKIDPHLLGGRAARLVEDAAREFWEANPAGEVLVAPVFFGPSRAITHYLPGRLEAVRAKGFSRARWRMAKCLVDCKNENDPCNALVAGALADAARRTVAEHQLSSRAKVLLVDHGSPVRAVTDVREWLGARVRALLGGEIACLGTASMERREGERYAFNEPLLASAFGAPPFDEGDVVVLLQFLSPGRHAGEAGDIEAICEAAKAGRAALRTWITDTVGASPQIAEVLRRRLAGLMV